MAVLARKCQQIFMIALFAFHTGKAVVRVAAQRAVSSIPHSCRLTSQSFLPAL
jgi:hypothetical protein